MNMLRRLWNRIVPPLGGEPPSVTLLTEPNVELITIAAAARQYVGFDYEDMRQQRVAEGPLNTANADRALRIVYEDGR